MQEGLGSSLPHREPFALEDAPGAAFMRGHDWTRSTLGSPDAWPAALRSATTLMLDSPVPMCVVWGPGMALLYNAPYSRILGRKHPAALGAPANQVWAEIWPEVEPLLATTLAGQALFREDLPLVLNRSGYEEQTWFTLFYSPLRDEAGVVRGVLCTIWETTEKMRARRDLARSQAALHESESRYRALFESIDEGFCVIEFVDGPDGALSDYTHVAANPAFAANTGIPDVVGQRVRELVPEEAAGWIEIYRKVLLTGEPVRLERELLQTGRHLELAAFRINPPERRQVAVLFQDVTQRHQAEQSLREMKESLERRIEEEVAVRIQAEEALRQTRRLEAAGHLTADTAREFDSALAMVMGALELLDQGLADGDTPAKRYVDVAKGGTRNAALLNQQLLALAGQRLEPDPADANSVVARLTPRLRHGLGRKVRLETIMAGGLWQTQADPEHLADALLSLALDGRDAMAEGGCVRIETANRELDSSHADDSTDVVAGRYVLVAVSDTGAGTFVQADARRADGLLAASGAGHRKAPGLGQVDAFARQSGGHIRTLPGREGGTTVEIYLPRRPQP